MSKNQPQRRPTRPQQPARGADSAQSEVEKGIDAIKWCYQTGQEFLRYPKNASGRRMILESAKEKRIPVGEARKYVQFVLTYTLQDLDELFAILREENFAMTFTHIQVLMAAESKAVRDVLTLQCAGERLSTDDLRQLKQRLEGSANSPSGRRPKMLKLDDPELEEAMYREVKRLRRHLEQVLARPREIRPDLRRRFQDLLKNLQ